MAMRVELDADHRLGPDQRPHALDDVAFDVVIAMRYHGAVQAEKDAVDRQRRLELLQYLVAHELVIGAVGRSRRTRRKAAALYQGEILRLGAVAGDVERRRAHQRRLVGMLAGAQEDAFLIGFDAGRQRREGVGLGGDGGGEQAHADFSGLSRRSATVMMTQAYSIVARKRRMRWRRTQ